MMVSISLPASVVVSHQLSPKRYKAAGEAIQLMNDAVQVAAGTRHAV
jgi:hypothetical protein